jgi:hypothetical protein
MPIKNTIMKKVLLATGLFLGICTFSFAQQTKPAKKAAPAKTEQSPAPATSSTPEKKTTHVVKHHKKAHAKKEDTKG